MPHIHRGPGEHDLTASAFVVRDDFEEPKLLLHMHKVLNKLLQPGGHVEPHENPWKAIEHELYEEAGYTFGELEVLQPKDRLMSLSGAALHPVPIVVNTHNFKESNFHKHTDISFAFLAHAAPQFQPACGESKDLRWLNLDELNSLDETHIIENIREIGNFVLQHVYPNWERTPTKY